MVDVLIGPRRCPRPHRITVDPGREVKILDFTADGWRVTLAS
jgi:hypothetical protein